MNDGGDDSAQTITITFMYIYKVDNKYIFFATLFSK